MTFTVEVGSIVLGGGVTVVIPTEEDITFIRFSAKEKLREFPQESAALVAEAKFKEGLREKYLARASFATYVLKKPEHRAVKMAQVKYSKGDPITGRTSVNQIGVMSELFPACIEQVPEDTTIAEYLEQQLYNSLYPSGERIDFLLSLSPSSTP